MLLRKIIRAFLLICSLAVLAACQKKVSDDVNIDASHTLSIRFKPMVAGIPLVMGDLYTNVWGEPYRVTAFKFYLTQIRLSNSVTGTSFSVNEGEYFLVNFSDTNTTVLNLRAIPSTYNTISFLLGVDSIRNVSGAQTGALDPAKGMFWTWNSGYIMAKLEGNSPVSTQPNQAFEYHIGGFAGADKVQQTVTLSFPSAQVQLPSNRSSSMIIEADVSTWFSNPNDIKLSVDPVCMTPGPLAKKIASNYSKMFSVRQFAVQ